MKKAFSSLRVGSASVPDRFVESVPTQVVDVEADTCLVHIDQPLTVPPQVTWTLDDEPASVEQLDPQLFKIKTAIPLMPGQELVMHSQITKLEDMQAQLQAFWSQRWQKFMNLPSNQWDRLLSFVRAYMPAGAFDLSPITVPMWDTINRRYTAQAARGPDGFDHMDLLNMPHCYSSGLVSLFNAIESGTSWPSQLLRAFCHPLPKHADATAVGEFRPIVIMSVLYRSWSALRSRSLLAQLKSRVSSGVVGFTPGREAGEIWHYVQALIECAFQSSSHLTGVVSDVRKAFESIPRSGFFLVARHLGLPHRLLDAWSQFLDRFERHFVLHGHFGPAITSNWGMPEGCGLSVVAMSLIDWCWDVYQSVFAPATVPLSYVDNYEVLARSIGELLTGFATLQTFMELWFLDLDGPKTYFWSTSSSDRQALRGLGKTVCLQHADLGGAMTYCRRTSIGSQQSRLDSLQPLWSRLRRSAAPLSVKFLLLRQAFWSKAFHAIGITLLPFRLVGSLRTQAVRALGFGRAGAQPSLRLALLCDNMQTDPGFYQVIRVLDDFRRFASKSSDIVQLWGRFVSHFDGKLQSGPFSKLFEVFGQLGRHLTDPPWVVDHDQCTWNLLKITTKLLHQLLTDAWHQRLAQEVAHRKDYDGLVGLTWPPSSHEHRLTALDSAAVNSIREGAFYVGQYQGKFDLSKGSLCPFCQHLDSVEHRCCHCPALASARSQHGGIVSQWTSLPRALTEHLLPSRNPWSRERKCALQGLADHVRTFDDRVTYSGGWVDFFTDGSCWDPGQPQLALAAWAVVSATHNVVLAAAPLAGLQQDINRAELTAAHSVLLWTWEMQGCSTLWTDSAYVGQGLHVLLQDNSYDSFDTNEDLWEQIAELLQALPPNTFRVQHVNSHRSQDEIDGPLEDWIDFWNNVADRNARLAHFQRPTSCVEVCQQYKQHHFKSETEVDRLRDLHLSIGKYRQTLLQQDEVVDVEMTDEPRVARSWQQAEDWLDAIPLGWCSVWRNSDQCLTFPVEVVQSFLDTLMAERDRAEGYVHFSWLEISAMLFVLDFCHPILQVCEGRTAWCPPANLAPAHEGQLTVASRIRFLKSLFASMDRVFGCGFDTVSGIDCKHLGIYPPQNGICMSVSSNVQRLVDQCLIQWTMRRPVRTSNDLSRPF